MPKFISILILMKISLYPVSSSQGHNITPGTRSDPKPNEEDTAIMDLLKRTMGSVLLKIEEKETHLNAMIMQLDYLRPQISERSICETIYDCELCSTLPQCGWCSDLERCFEGN